MVVGTYFDENFTNLSTELQVQRIIRPLRLMVVVGPKLNSLIKKKILLPLKYSYT